MTVLAVVGAGAVLSGQLHSPRLPEADTIVCADGRISAIGRAIELGDSIAKADCVLQANGATVAPGLIDSHCHVVLGDYTPRQKTVDFLDSYVHGGITSCVSPGEIHAPGRPRDAEGVASLAIAAHACFQNFRPNGMKVHAGTVILEPTLTDAHFGRMAAAGISLAKFGFGNYADPLDGHAQIIAAQAYGIRVMCHTGGASIPGSSPITTEHLLTMRPDIAGHVNGGPTAPDLDGVTQVIRETDMALQLVQAGNLRSSLDILRVARAEDALERVVIGSDTPTGTGVMPLGVLKTLAEIASLGDLAPDEAWALATGNNRHVFDLEEGVLQVGAPADLVVLDAPWGSAADNALDALAHGDIPGISAVVIDGTIRTLRSRNTPTATRAATTRPALQHLNH